MNTTQKQSIDILHGSIWKGIFQFALPVAATAVLGQLFNAADVAIVGSFTAENIRNIAVAAVGANSPIVGLIVSLFIGIALGATVVTINDNPDGFNVNENAGSTHIEGLQKLVIEKGLDVGFAYDGDADRCLCVDEKGQVLTGDHILYIYGKYMKERDKLLTNTVVTTVMSNFGLYKAFDEIGIEYAKTAVGDKYVYEYMQKNGCRIGGEQSGHIIFSKYATTGDGILTSLKIMEVIMDTITN